MNNCRYYMGLVVTAFMLSFPTLAASAPSATQKTAANTTSLLERPAVHERLLRQVTCAVLIPKVPTSADGTLRVAPTARRLLGAPLWTTAKRGA